MESNQVYISPQEPVPFTLNPGGVVKIDDLRRLVPGAIGLKYLRKNGVFIRLRIINERVFPPPGGWGKRVYLPVFRNSCLQDQNPIAGPSGVRVRKTFDENMEAITIGLEKLKKQRKKLESLARYRYTDKPPHLFSIRIRRRRRARTQPPQPSSPEPQEEVSTSGVYEAENQNGPEN